MIKILLLLAAAIILLRMSAEFTNGINGALGDVTRVVEERMK